jgi:hypothetical protein
MKRLVLITLGGALAAALVAGCSTSVSDGDNGTNANPENLYDGYTTSAEAPAFGDADLLAGHPEDLDYDDEVRHDPEVGSAMSNGRAKFYMVRLVWGNVENPDTTLACPVTDWSGSIAADGGVLIVRRLIRFEPEDYIVRPRRGAHDVNWISHTMNGVDGLLVQVIDVPDSHSPHKTTANSIKVTTPLYTAEIPFDSLAAFAQTVTFDGCNKIAVTSSEITNFACPRGFLEGAWISESDTSGSFKGAWVKDNGALDGYLQGHYALRDGERVLFGKWITTAGDFGGLMRGTWGPPPGDDLDDARHTPDGWFEGHWVNEALTVEGAFRGHYCLPESPDTAGFFHGRWAEDCR